MKTVFTDLVWWSAAVWLENYLENSLQRFGRHGFSGRTILSVKEVLVFVWWDGIYLAMVWIEFWSTLLLFYWTL